MSSPLGSCTFRIPNSFFNHTDEIISGIKSSIALIRQSGFFIFGVKGFASDGIARGIKLIRDSQPIEDLAKKVKQVSQSILYGGSLIISGTLGVYAEVALILEQQTTPHIQKIQQYSNYLFIFSSVLSLKINIDLYFEGKEKKHSLNPLEQDRGREMMNSAVMGILSSISYIIGSLLLLFEAATVLVIILCGIGTTLAFSQMFHDMILL